jgi:hypothetical protein
MLDVDILPTQSPENDSPPLHSHWLFGQHGEDTHASRVVCDNASEEQGARDSMSKVEAMIMSEVAEFLQSSQCDDWWRPRNKPPQRVGHFHRRKVCD